MYLVSHYDPDEQQTEKVLVGNDEELLVQINRYLSDSGVSVEKVE